MLGVLVFCLKGNCSISKMTFWVEGTSITNHGILYLTKLVGFTANLEEFTLTHDNVRKLKCVEGLRDALKGKGMDMIFGYSTGTHYKK